MTEQPYVMEPWSVWSAPGIRAHRHQATTYISLDEHLFTAQDVAWLRFHLGEVSGASVYVAPGLPHSVSCRLDQP